MGKFFGMNKKQKKGQDPSSVKEEHVAVDDVVIPRNDADTAPTATTKEEKVEVCPDDIMQSTPIPGLLEETLTINTTTISSAETLNDNGLFGTGYDSTILASLAVSAVLVLALLGWNLGFRRKTRLQRRMWKKDSKMILTRVEDVMHLLEERDEELDIMQQKLKVQEATAQKEKEELEQESSKALQAKDEECELLKSKIEDLTARQAETEARCEQVSAENKKMVEDQQDHECQLLEQKLQASQLSNTLSEREVTIEELQKTNATQLEQISQLQQKIKSDSIKAEKIIGDLTSERDDRFSILQQENEAIKSTIMSMLKTTQEKYDADKVVLKKEMRKREDKIASLQQELWKSNGLLKRFLQTESSTTNQDSMSQSMRNLIAEVKDSKLGSSSKDGNGSIPQRRSSTYDAAETILEGEGGLAELAALENMLSTSSK